LWHVLFEFGNSSFDEYGLQAAYLGQELSMAAFCIMNAGVLEILRFQKPLKINEFMNQISKGWALGNQSKNMLYVIWEEYLDKNILDVRSEFSIIIK
jgi:ubiquinone biosynthesis protein Coq4